MVRGRGGIGAGGWLSKHYMGGRWLSKQQFLGGAEEDLCQVRTSPLHLKRSDARIPIPRRGPSPGGVSPSLQSVVVCLKGAETTMEGAEEMTPDDESDPSSSSTRLTPLFGILKN